MANIYGRSTTGVNTNSGAGWATADLDLGGTSGCATDAVAGDTIFLSQVHAESTAAAVVVTLAGTPALPVKVICANDAAEPPTAVATTAIMTGTSNITINNSGYFYGITFRPGSGGSVTQSFLSGAAGAAHNQVYDNCCIDVLTTGTGQAHIAFGDDGRTDVFRGIVNSTPFRLLGANMRVKVSCHYSQYGGSFLAGSASLVNVYESGLRGIAEWLVVGADYSANIGTAFNLIIQPTGGNPFTARFYAMKLPTGWTGRPWSAKPLSPGMRAEIFDSLIGTTRLRAWCEDYAGESIDSVTVYRNGGFVDDVDAANVSIRMTTSANSSYPVVGHKGVPLNFSVSTSGTPITKYIEVAHDSQGSGTAGALTDGDIIVELMGPSGYTSNVKATILTAATAHATSSQTWTGTGIMTTPLLQRLAITFTPPRKGGYTMRPVLFIPSKTVYYCQKAT